MPARKSATSLASLLNSRISSRVKRGCDKCEPRPDAVPDDAGSNIVLEDEQAAIPAAVAEVSKKRLPIYGNAPFIRIKQLRRIQKQTFLSPAQG